MIEEYMVEIDQEKGIRHVMIPAKNLNAAIKAAKELGEKGKKITVVDPDGRPHTVHNK